MSQGPKSHQGPSGCLLFYAHAYIYIYSGGREREREREIYIYIDTYWIILAYEYIDR